MSRLGRPDTAFSLQQRSYFHGLPVDLELGTRRARAAALLTMALPGSVYVYQGEELGLWEVQDIPDELRQDPIWHRTGGRRIRAATAAGCRCRGRPGAAVRLLAARLRARSRGCRSRRSGAT